LSETNWNSLNWLGDAKELLHWFQTKDTKGFNSMLVIRHSHREDSDDVKDLLEKRLSDLGHKMAFLFGCNIPQQRNIEIFYSRHPRCFETAQNIANGCSYKNQVVRLVSDIRVLLGPKGSGDQIGQQMLDLGGPEFIQRWIDGRLSEEIIEPIHDFGTVFLNETIGRLQEAYRGTMQIHVTHDLVLMGARNIIFGTMPTKENWTPYLGGFGIISMDGLLRGYERGEEHLLNTSTFSG
jgi:hypothetical protein